MGRVEEGFTTGEEGVMAVGRVEQGVMVMGRGEDDVMAVGSGEEGVTGCFSAVEVTNTRQMQGIFVAALVQGKVGWQTVAADNSSGTVGDCKWGTTEVSD